MTTRQVYGTRTRNGRYSFNLTIPEKILHLYPDAKGGRLRRAMHTTDADEAERQVREQKAIFDRQEKEVNRLADRDKVLASLSKEDRDLLSEIGGPEKLLAELRSLRAVAAFEAASWDADLRDDTEIEGGEDAVHAPFGKHAEVEWKTPQPPRRVSGGGEAVEGPPRARSLEQQATRLAHEARMTTLTGEARRLKRLAAEAGETPAPPPAGIDEGVSGARELAEGVAKAESYTVKNKEKLDNSVRRWIDLHGDIPPERWTRAHLDQFDEMLTRMTSSSAKRIRSAPLTVAVSIAEAENLPLLASKTRKRYIDDMKSLTAHAVNRAGTLTADPFAGFKPRRSKEKFSAQQNGRKSFTKEQVGRILDYCHSTFDPEVMDFWLPLLSAYTGARREELGQLTTKNVRLVGNIHILDITDEEEHQNVKNKHSIRNVPLPSPIIDAGFLEYVERRRQAGGHFLFVEDYTHKNHRVERREVQPNKYGQLSANYGDRFTRKVREPLGLKEEGLVFHSLRHSWTDAARRAKIDPEIRRLIAGRLEDEDIDTNATEAGYGDDALLPEKLEALELIAKHLRA